MLVRRAGERPSGCPMRTGELRVCNVGELRQQSALCDATTPVVLVVEGDPVLAEALCKMRVVRCYPDTTDGAGNFGSTFKIVVELSR